MEEPEIITEYIKAPEGSDALSVGELRRRLYDVPDDAVLCVHIRDNVGEMPDIELGIALKLNDDKSLTALLVHQFTRERRVAYLKSI